MGGGETERRKMGEDRSEREDAGRVAFLVELLFTAEFILSGSNKYAMGMS